MRWMPVWCWEEIRLARTLIFGQEEVDVRGKYDRRRSIPCSVLQQIAQQDQILCIRQPGNAASAHSRRASPVSQRGVEY